MQRGVAAGGRPERASSWTILCDLQACVAEPVRIIHYVVRRLFCDRGTLRGTETDGRRGEESPVADYDDYCKQRADDDPYDDDERSKEKEEDEDEDEEEEEEEEDEEEDWRPPGLPPSLTIPCYDGDGSNVHAAYGFSRYLVELLSVRPRFPFVGSFFAFNDRSIYHFSSLKGQKQDSQGRLILRAQGLALEDGFQIRVEIPEDDNRIEDGNLVFSVDPYAVNRVITDTIVTSRYRKIDVTFVPLCRAIMANVLVRLDLVSARGGTRCYVHGEISAHHRLYGDENNVVLFFREEEDKAEVTDGKLALLRPWAAVPIYLDPLLTIKLSLHVTTDPEDGLDGRTNISFHGDLTFDRDQYEKSICSADHGEVKVWIGYQ